MHIFLTFFSWPDGAVWGNLIASLLTAIPIWFLAKWRIKVHSHRREERLHNHLTQEFIKLKESIK